LALLPPAAVTSTPAGNGTRPSGWTTSALVGAAFGVTAPSTCQISVPRGRIRWKSWTTASRTPPPALMPPLCTSSGWLPTASHSAISAMRKARTKSSTTATSTGSSSSTTTTSTTTSSSTMARKGLRGLT